MSAPATLSPGMLLPPLTIDAVDPEKMKLMAALLRDPNPIHIDADAVAALGLGERPINQGPANLSYLLNMVVGWRGAIDSLRSVDVRFLGNVFAGDRVECHGTVTAVDPETGLATLDVHATAGDRRVLQGTILVA